MLYTTYRPQSFKDVIGQENNLITLRQQVETKKFDNAYLFAGHRGTGKTTIARIMARSMNCKAPSKDGPCNQCESCISMLKNATLDFVELDAASHNSINDIKELIDSTKYVPTHLSKKIYIIDEVHNLSSAAFDALLKTIEEPPSHCVFILCTTELHKIPSTIRSRCSIYQFNALSIEVMKERLSYVMNELEKPYEELALSMIAKQADGSMRDALSIAEKLIISCDKLTVDHLKSSLCLMDEELSLSILESIIEVDCKKSIQLLQKTKEEGKNLSYLTDNLIQCFTDGIILYTSEGLADIYNTDEYRFRLYESCKKTSLSMLFWYVDILASLREKIRNSLDPYLEVILHIIKCCNPKLFADQIIILNERISLIEDILKNPAKLMSLQENETKEDLIDTREAIVDDSFTKIEETSEKIPFSEDTIELPDEKKVEEPARAEEKESSEESEKDDDYMEEIDTLFSDYL